MALYDFPVAAKGGSTPLVQVKRAENGRGPYRWAHVVKSPAGDFRQGSIYRQLGDDLGPDEVKTLTRLCGREGFDLRCVKSITSQF